MTMIYGTEQLLHDACGLGLIEDLVFLCCDFVKKFAPWAILHDQVHVLGVLVSLVILNDVRVVERCKNPDLLLYSLDLLRC